VHTAISSLLSRTTGRHLLAFALEDLQHAVFAPFPAYVELCCMIGPVDDCFLSRRRRRAERLVLGIIPSAVLTLKRHACLQENGLRRHGFSSVDTEGDVERLDQVCSNR
jgi:hypothetical protein